MLSANDRDTLTWLRWHWGQEYAVNCDGTIWTAIPALQPDIVLSEPTAAGLRAAMYLDAASRRMRSGATAQRWARFSTPADQPPATPLPGTGPGILPEPGR